MRTNYTLNFTFDFTNLITEKKNSQQYVVLYTEMSYNTGLLNSGYSLAGPVAKNV